MVFMGAYKSLCVILASKGSLLVFLGPYLSLLFFWFLINFCVLLCVLIGPYRS